MPMKPASRRSLLQVRILLRLQQGPTRTVSELATAVGARRPSVSRSLKTLRNDELVARKRNGWTLTPTGADEANRCDHELSRAADSLRRTIQGVAAVDVMKSANPISGSLAGGVMAKTMGSTSLASLVEAHRPLSSITQSLTSLAEAHRPLSVIAQSLTPLAEAHRPLSVVAQSLAPLAEAHRTLSGVMAQSLAIPNLGLVISRNNAMIAGAIEDIQAVCSAPNIRVHGVGNVLYPGVLRDIQDIGDSYHTLLSETAKITVAREDLSEMHHSWSRMLVPSSTLANFTYSLRSEVALEPEMDSVTLPHISDGEAPQETLEHLLTDLNPDLVDKWQGSWQALRESNPDGLSQASFSYRELIRMVLDELAPNVEVDHSKQESKRKKQVRHVLDGREGDFAQAMVEGLPRLYDFLSKSAHTSYRNRVAVQAALLAGDGLLLILLSSRRR